MPTRPARHDLQRRTRLRGTCEPRRKNYPPLVADNHPTSRRVPGRGLRGFWPLGTRQKAGPAILSYRIESRVAILLAYELHVAGKGDNSVIGDPDWRLFGMDRADVLDQLKRAALTGVFIVQSAGSVTRIAWQCKDLKELTNVLTQS